MEKLKQLTALSFILFILSYQAPTLAPFLSLTNNLLSSMGKDVRLTGLDAEEDPTTGDCWDRSYKAILVVEGGRSNHPNDRGGLTYKGITTAVAQRETGQPDPTKLTDQQIKDIYKKSYWEKSGADKHPWPLCLAIYNSYVNSGRKWNISRTGTNYEKAINYLDQQLNYYHTIVKRDRSQRVFLKGWLNRDRYLRRVMTEE